MADVSAAEAAIRKACGTGKDSMKPKPKESRQAFLSRLHASALGLDERGWDDLPTDAQKWVNDGTRAKDDSLEIPDFDDDEEEAPPPPKKTAKKAAPDDDEEAPAPKKTAKKAAPEPDKKSAGKKKEVAVRAVGADGVKYRIKKLLLVDPKMPAEDIMKKLDGEPSRLTVNSIRAEFRHSLKVLRDEDFLPKDFPEI